MDTRKLLLTATDIAAMAGQRKVHFLNPNAIRLNKSLGDAIGLQHLGVHIIEVAPGHEATEYHRHLYEEECVYVLSGQATLVIEGDRYPVGAGDFFGLPRNTAAHTLLNEGEETLVCLVMGQRLEQDVSDYPQQGKRLYRNSGQWELVDIGQLRDPRKA